MAKVKIPLEVANGFMARNMEELKENFDIKKIVGHLLDGKLHKWLEDRYYDEELDAIEKLSKTDERLADKLCKIFGVEQDTSDIDIEAISKTNEKLAVIRGYTDDDKLIDQVDHIARNQQDLDELVKYGEKKIYLLEGTYKINLKHENVKYVGLKNVIAYIPSKEIVSFRKKNIEFKNIEFDEKYKELEKTKVVSNPFALTRDKVLFVDENGKLNFIHKEAFAYNKLYNNDVSGVLKDISSAKKKNTAEKYFEEQVKSRIVSVCASGDMFGAIDEKGNAYTWGTDEKVSLVTGITDIVQMECGLNKYFALDNQGTLIVWDKEAREYNIYDDGRTLKQISVNYGMALGVNNAGDVFILAQSTPDSRANMPVGLPPIKKLTVGRNAVYALSEDGKIYAWGNKYTCQLPENLPVISDIGIPGECTPVVDVFGEIHLCGRKGTISEYKTKLVDIPKIKGVIGELFDYVWCISNENEIYRDNQKMKIKRRNQEETIIKIYDNN